MPKEPPRPTLRSDHYFVVETQTHCLYCREAIDVIAILLPEGHAQCDPLDGDPDEFANEEEYQAWLNGPDSWEWREDCGWSAMLCDIRYLSPSVVKQLREQTGTKRFRRNKGHYSGEQMWLN